MHGAGSVKNNCFHERKFNILEKNYMFVKTKDMQRFIREKIGFDRIKLFKKY